MSYRLTKEQLRHKIRRLSDRLGRRLSFLESSNLLLDGGDKHTLLLVSEKLEACYEILNGLSAID